MRDIFETFRDRTTMSVLFSNRKWHTRHCTTILAPVLRCISLTFRCVNAPCGTGAPLSPLFIYFLIFSPFYFSLSFIGFTYFLLLSISSLSTRIVPLRFQAGGRRRRPNLGLVCVLFCIALSVFLS